jgi:hypothetical protein
VATGAEHGQGETKLLGSADDVIHDRAIVRIFRPSATRPHGP